jgi:hypothetical protein
MTKRIMVLITLILLCGSCVNVEVEEKHINTKDKACEGDKLLRHVVLFAFKDSTTPGQIEQVEINFSKMSHEISEIHDFEWGTNLDNNQRSKGFTHCFVVTFKSEEDLKIYEVHPVHEKFKTETIGQLEDFLVMDFWQDK